MRNCQGLSTRLGTLGSPGLSPGTREKGTQTIGWVGEGAVGKFAVS